MDMLLYPNKCTASVVSIDETQRLLSYALESRKDIIKMNVGRTVNSFIRKKDLISSKHGEYKKKKKIDA